MKECVTHHHACDCREAAHKAEIDALEAKIDLLQGSAEPVGWVRPDELRHVGKTGCFLCRVAGYQYMADYIPIFLHPNLPPEQQEELEMLRKEVDDYISRSNQLEDIFVEGTAKIKSLVAENAALEKRLTTSDELLKAEWEAHQETKSQLADLRAKAKASLDAHEYYVDADLRIEEADAALRQCLEG